VLFLTAGLLVLGGLLMVSSTSLYPAMRLNLDPEYFLIRQCVWTCIGLVALLITMNVPYGRLADGRVVLAAVAVSLVLLIVVLAMPAIGGAHRWLVLGPLRLQPSEFAKLSAILFTAHVLSRKEEQVNDFGAVPLPLVVVLAPIAFLIVIEPDLGSAMMLATAVSVMVFVAGLRWRYVFALGGCAAVALAVGILARPYRRERLLAFLTGDADHSVLYQLNQSLVALGHGGPFGVGLGNGQQKAYFLPEAHTDFVYAVIGEEFGLAGTLMVLAAFLILFWRGLRAAFGAPDRFGFHLALGITTLLVLQALINMGVCVGLFPTKGLALPFLSYGGSSLVATLAATGVLLNVSQHSS